MYNNLVYILMEATLTNAKGIILFQHIKTFIVPAVKNQ